MRFSVRVSVRGRSSALGYTILESCCVTLLGFTLILGLTDVFRTFQTHLVLREAADLAVRQATTVAGGAVTYQPAGGARYYDWYRYDWIPAADPPQRQRSLLAADVPEGAVPAICQNAPLDESCERIAADADISQAAALRYDIAPVLANYAQREVERALPRARFGCSAGLTDAHCVQISTTPANLAVLNGAPVDSQRPVNITVTVRYALPLWALFSRVITVSGAGQRRLETGSLDYQSYVKMETPGTQSGN